MIFQLVEVNSSYQLDESGYFVESLGYFKAFKITFTIPPSTPHTGRRKQSLWTVSPKKKVSQSVTRF